MLPEREQSDGQPKAPVSRDHLGISGLIFFPNLLDVEQQEDILWEVDSRPWLNDLRRRVQHYGYRYDYKARQVNPSMIVGPLPDFAVEIGKSLLRNALVEELPDQLIVNEYAPGQGISAHVDCEPCFKNVIVTISLGSVYEMDFLNLKSKEVRSILLELGSAVVMRDEARYDWAHRIQSRKSDRGVPRGRRVSLTFRNVILNDEPERRGIVEQHFRWHIRIF
jgi:alkylated DNA repair dioxygenase AlkB